MEIFDPNRGKVLGQIKIPVSGLDDRGRVIGYVDEPTFCGGSTEQEIIDAFEGRTQYGDNWDLSRHIRAGSKNPEQCESNRQYDLATGKHYRESPASLLKNLGAGLVNGLIPGSDLGDAGSSTQLPGQLLGSVVGLFVSPAQLVSLATKPLQNVSLISTIGKSIGGILANPAINTIIGTVGGALLTPRQPGAPMATTPQQAVRPQNPFMLSPGSYPQAGGFVFDGGGYKVSTPGAQTTPTWLMPVIIAGAVVFALFTFLKRKK